LLREDWDKAKALFTEAIELLTAGGDPVRGDLAAAYFNLAGAQIALNDFRAAADSAEKARNIDASIYGGEHPELIIDGSS
jgi:hypothetical protein